MNMFCTIIVEGKLSGKNDEFSREYLMLFAGYSEEEMEPKLQTPEFQQSWDALKQLEMEEA